MYPNELYHHGRLGQKWGEQNGPPYPLSRSVVQREYGSKKVHTFSRLLSTRKDKKEMKKNRIENVKKAMSVNTLTDDEKKLLVIKGSASDVIRYKDQLSNTQLQEALSRIRYTKELIRISQEEQDKGWKTLNEVMKRVGNVKDWTKTGVEMYDQIQEVLKRIDTNRKQNLGNIK